MSDFYTTTDNRIVVRSNPTIKFQNGMTLWLGDEGESVELSHHDWKIIEEINALVLLIGATSVQHVIKPEVDAALNRTWWGRFYNLFWR